RHRHPRPPPASLPRREHRRQKLQAPRTRSSGSQAMSRVTRGKLDVPQLRESRCPLTPGDLDLHLARVGVHWGRVPEQVLELFREGVGHHVARPPTNLDHVIAEFAAIRLVTLFSDSHDLMAEV